MLHGFQNKFVVIYDGYLSFPHLEKSKIGLVNAMVLTADIEVSNGSRPELVARRGMPKKYIQNLVIFASKICPASLRRDLWPARQRSNSATIS
jgi:hypothetical protein